jgi:prefoldin subunit 5
MTIQPPTQPLERFVRLLLGHQAIFFGPFLAAFVLVHLLLRQSVFGAIALLGSGVLAVVADLACFRAVPTAFLSRESEGFARAASIGTGALIGFVAMTSVLVPTGAFSHALIVCVLKLLVPIGFGFFAFRSFRDDVWPLQDQIGADPQAYQAALAERKTLRTEEHRARQRHQLAVVDARRKVLTFFRENQKVLAAHVSEAWLLAEVQAQIPDEANEQAAYAGASKLLSQLDVHVRAEKGKQEERTRQRQQRLAEIDRQLSQAQQSLESLQRSSVGDPEVREEELAALRRRQKDLLAEKAQLQRQP